MEGAVRFEPLEAQIAQDTVQLLVSLPGSLLEAIEQLLELENLVGTTLY